jgi:HlyD family secretion protein
MTHKRPPVPVLVLLALIVIVGGYFLIARLTARNNGALTASGTIEAVEITISPEIGGKVVEVFVDEGNEVQTGDPLFRLDDTLLQAQRAVATANLDLATGAASTADAALATAQANYDLAVATARAESAASRTSDWASEFGSTTTQSEELIAATNEVDDALAARDAAQESLSTLISDPASSDFAAAETRLLDARAAFNVAQAVLLRANLSTNADLRDAAQTDYDDANTELDDAQTAYDELKNSDAAQVILTARAELAVAQERYEAARDRLLLLQTGDYSLRVAVSAAALRQAEASAAQAHLTIAQAQASLDLVDVQIAKLTVLAPVDGVILSRSIQPGEVVAVGAKALSLGRLVDLSITVYVPEDRYGELSLGQPATVTVDSFPDLTFTATITHISDEAEFTPRNVQTVEGRSSTVYAIRLKVEDTEGRLKPGMPADVTFDVER